MSIEYIGYHATSRDNACRILKDGFSVQSVGPDQWLGDGIYFFEDSIGWAKWWASSKVKAYTDGVILEARIIVPTDDNLLDLLDYNVLEGFEQFRDKTLKRIHKRYREIRHPNGPYDAGFVNLICEDLPKIKLVRAAFQVKTQLNVVTAGQSRIARTHIQLCCRDVGCIKDVKQIKP